MENIVTQEYIESGEYFRDAKRLYSYKYIRPFSDRSVLAISVLCFLFLLYTVFIDIKDLFPVVQQVEYVISGDVSGDKTAHITRANSVENDPTRSVVHIILDKYVTRRENYNYDSIKQNMIFVKNMSSRIVFNDFYKYASIDNPDSPIMRYKKEADRRITILNKVYSENNTVDVFFKAITTRNDGIIIEDKLFKAEIQYEVDNLSTNAQHGTKFHFLIINYNVKEVENQI